MPRNRAIEAPIAVVRTFCVGIHQTGKLCPTRKPVRSAAAGPTGRGGRGPPCPTLPATPFRRAGIPCASVGKLYRPGARARNTPPNAFTANSVPASSLGYWATPQPHMTAATPRADRRRRGQGRAGQRAAEGAGQKEAHHFSLVFVSQATPSPSRSCPSERSVAKLKLAAASPLHPGVAVKDARLEGKDLFVVLTGHGWCYNCELLDREVFQKPEFVRKVSENFVCVELDFKFGLDWI